MTCIVGVIDRAGSIWIGGDSAAMEITSYHLELRADKKVFTRVDESGATWAFGFMTSFRMGQLIHYNLHLPKIEVEDRQDLHKFLVTKFIPALRKCLSEGGLQMNQQGRESGGTFLLGLLGELFVVHEDYQIAKSIHSFAAVGAGATVALGALGATKRWKNPKRRIEEALGLAETLNAAVRRPFHIVVARNE